MRFFYKGALVATVKGREWIDADEADEENDWIVDFLNNEADRKLWAITPDLARITPDDEFNQLVAESVKAQLEEYGATDVSIERDG